MVDRVDAKDMWAAVRQLTGHKQEQTVDVDGVNAATLNNHYARISTDNMHTIPSLKQTVSPVFSPSVSEEHIFKILDKLKLEWTNYQIGFWGSVLRFSLNL